MSYKQKQDNPDASLLQPVGIAFEINAESNTIMTHSARMAERTKKAEAKLRLQDHLKRFPNWKP
jgi:hypothetical protein